MTSCWAANKDKIAALNSACDISKGELCIATGCNFSKISLGTVYRCKKSL